MSKRPAKKKNDETMDTDSSEALDETLPSFSRRTKPFKTSKEKVTGSQNIFEAEDEVTTTTPVIEQNVSKQQSLPIDARSENSLSSTDTDPSYCKRGKRFVKPTKAAPKSSNFHATVKEVSAIAEQDVTSNDDASTVSSTPPSAKQKKMFRPALKKKIQSGFADAGSPAINSSQVAGDNEKSVLNKTKSNNKTASESSFSSSPSFRAKNKPFTSSATQGRSDFDAIPFPLRVSVVNEESDRLESSPSSDEPRKAKFRNRPSTQQTHFENVGSPQKVVEDEVTSETEADVETDQQIEDELAEIHGEEAIVDTTIRNTSRSRVLAVSLNTSQRAEGNRSVNASKHVNQSVTMSEQTETTSNASKKSGKSQTIQPVDASSDSQSAFSTPPTLVKKKKLFRQSVQKGSQSSGLKKDLENVQSPKTSKVVALETDNTSFTTATPPSEKRNKKFRSQKSTANQDIFEGVGSQKEGCSTGDDSVFLPNTDTTTVSLSRSKRSAESTELTSSPTFTNVAKPFKQTEKSSQPKNVFDTVAQDSTDTTSKKKSLNRSKRLSLESTELTSSPTFTNVTKPFKQNEKSSQPRNTFDSIIEDPGRKTQAESEQLLNEPADEGVDVENELVVVSDSVPSSVSGSLSAEPQHNTNQKDESNLSISRKRKADQSSQDSDASNTSSPPTFARKPKAFTNPKKRVSLGSRHSSVADNISKDISQNQSDVSKLSESPTFTRKSKPFAGSSDRNKSGMLPGESFVEELKSTASKKRRESNQITEETEMQEGDGRQEDEAMEIGDNADEISHHSEDGQEESQHEEDGQEESQHEEGGQEKSQHEEDEEMRSESDESSQESDESSQEVGRNETSVSKSQEVTKSIAKKSLSSTQSSTSLNEKTSSSQKSDGQVYSKSFDATTQTGNSLNLSKQGESVCVQVGNSLNSSKRTSLDGSKRLSAVSATQSPLVPIQEMERSGNMSRGTEKSISESQKLRRSVILSQHMSKSRNDSQAGNKSVDRSSSRNKSSTNMPVNQSSTENVSSTTSKSASRNSSQNKSTHITNKSSTRNSSQNMSTDTTYISMNPTSSGNKSASTSMNRSSTGNKSTSTGISTNKSSTVNKSSSTSMNKSSTVNKSASTPTINQSSSGSKSVNTTNKSVNKSKRGDKSVTDESSDSEMSSSEREEKSDESQEEEEDSEEEMDESQQETNNSRQTNKSNTRTQSDKSSTSKRGSVSNESQQSQEEEEDSEEEINDSQQETNNSRHSRQTNKSNTRTQSDKSNTSMRGSVSNESQQSQEEEEDSEEEINDSQQETNNSRQTNKSNTRAQSDKSSTSKRGSVSNESQHVDKSNTTRQSETNAEERSGNSLNERSNNVSVNHSKKSSTSLIGSNKSSTSLNRSNKTSTTVSNSNKSSLNSSQQSSASLSRSNKSQGRVEENPSIPEIDNEEEVDAEERNSEHDESAESSNEDGERSQSSQEDENSKEEDSEDDDIPLAGMVSRDSQTSYTRRTAATPEGLLEAIRTEGGLEMTRSHLSAANPTLTTTIGSLPVIPTGNVFVQSDSDGEDTPLAEVQAASRNSVSRAGANTSRQATLDRFVQPTKQTTQDTRKKLPPRPKAPKWSDMLNDKSEKPCSFPKKMVYSMFATFAKIPVRKDTLDKVYETMGKFEYNLCKRVVSNFPNKKTITGEDMKNMMQDMGLFDTEEQFADIVQRNMGFEDQGLLLLHEGKKAAKKKN